MVKKLNKEAVIQKPIKYIFMDEMRFGLISNYKRSWSKIGKRTVIQNQQEFDNRYLYSAIDPINGDNFHMIGFNGVNADTTKLFLDRLKEEYKDYYIMMIWDNAPFHRRKDLHNINELTPINLPSYSPQLNPVERFYGEIRKITANRIFKDIEAQQKIIDDEVVRWMGDKERVKNLCGYDWILEQVELCS